ncbi:PssE/Cps14G family polysaccharide biosynthesis glycosyltransferase [Alkalicoccobacillus murimartini]|uniref:UDP-N-acetylglucosamine transferase subunit ALG13 n=1 Tax=Alkalicoccobacillus murimartini TaxID=171685 RepID=A0ABT9YGK3_9BACI|nr:PssE/Cps14G family polysaccharide biosynthesis glycosyltransferase [Alkalicoccobacillus murimartini]MDQ0206992.1 UDP-N-acetylglucosamine transferase subunit ALG13 [Alkalicoccobacillus murimartini]
MIFIITGSQKFQFDRLLIKMDEISCELNLKTEIYAQTGYSNYAPKNFKFKNFLNKNEFEKQIEKSEILITHGGTGSIMKGVKSKKKVIAIPRMKKYKEHVDNHQIEIIKEFDNLNLIYGLYEIENLKDALIDIKRVNMGEYKSNTKDIINSINDFLYKV